MSAAIAANLSQQARARNRFPMNALAIVVLALFAPEPSAAPAVLLSEDARFAGLVKRQAAMIERLSAEKLELIHENARLRAALRKQKPRRNRQGP